jgi:hypothetical protein
MQLRTVLAACAVTVGLAAVPACGPSSSGPAGLSRASTDMVTSGDCPNERAVVRRALRGSHIRVDVSGDGRLDTVAVASRPGAEKPCRAFVGVRVSGGHTYSAHLFPLAAPVEGLRARLVGLPELGGRPGAELVVDTRAAADALLAQMFTLAGGRLRVVAVPVSEDGTFIVEGGGVIYPHAAACTADGDMVFTEAAQTRDGKRFRVVRRTYEAGGHRIRLADPTVERAVVPVDRLVDRFPEYGRPHWKACSP